MKRFLFAAFFAIVVLATSADVFAQTSSVGTVQQAFVSSRFDGIYTLGDPACQTTPDGLAFSLVGVVPNPPGVNPSRFYFVPRTHRDYDVIAAMVITAKAAGTNLYVLADPTLICGMPVVDLIGVV